MQRGLSFFNLYALPLFFAVDEDKQLTSNPSPSLTRSFWTVKAKIQHGQNHLCLLQLQGSWKMLVIITNPTKSNKKGWKFRHTVDRVLIHSVFDFYFLSWWTTLESIGTDVKLTESFFLEKQEMTALYCTSHVHRRSRVWKSFWAGYRSQHLAVPLKAIEALSRNFTHIGFVK